MLLSVRPLAVALGLAAVALGLALAAPAAADEAGRGFLEARIGYYTNDDGGGNPFLDESETVIEPVVVLDYNVTDRLGATATFSYDLVSSASIDRLSRYPEQSGASGDTYFGGELGLRYKLTDDLRVGVRGSMSTEYDYKSIGGGLDLALDLADDAATIKLGGSFFSDTVRVIRFDGEETEGDEDRTSIAINVGWYQILSPDAHIDLGYTYGHQTGFLETAFNSVVLEDPSDPPNPFLENNARGVEVAEELSDVRTRHALHGEVRHTLGDWSSVGLGGRFYTDSWGITSFSAEPRFYHWIVPDVLRGRVRYRFYDQSAADDYMEHFDVAPADRARFVAEEERTQDSDLGDFSSHTLGLELYWHVSTSVSLNLAGDYILRSDGIDQILIAGGVRWDF